MSDLLNVSTLLIILTILVGLTNIVTQVIKKFTYDKIPSSLLAFIVSEVLSIVALFIYLAIIGNAFIWYYLIIAIIVGFMTAYAAMFGFDKLKEIITGWTAIKASIQKLPIKTIRKYQCKQCRKETIMTDFKKPNTFSSLPKAVKTAYETTPVIPKPTKIAVGNIVKFLGGSVFLSANTSVAVATKKEGLCEVIRIHDGVHKYRCISTDGSGIDGWVDESNLIKL
jgi:hypothetical protein